jgi:Skp family chaperone for outer membrane proteins
MKTKSNKVQAKVKKFTKSLTIREAKKLAKSGAKILRASNGSFLGSYYLNKYKNLDHSLKLIVIQ